jgi:hypothetical protein
MTGLDPWLTGSAKTVVRNALLATPSTLWTAGASPAGGRLRVQFCPRSNFAQEMLPLLPSTAEPDSRGLDPAIFCRKSEHLDECTAVLHFEIKKLNMLAITSS